MQPVQVLCLSSNPIFYTHIQQLIESESSHLTWGGHLCSHLPTLSAHNITSNHSVILICDDPALPTLTQHLHPRNNPNITFLIYTLTDKLQDFEYFRMLGFRGIVTAQDSLLVLHKAIKKVSHRQWWFPSQLLDKIYDDHITPSFSRIPQLDFLYAKLRSNDLKLLRCLIKLPHCKCLILADALSLSERTIRNHLSHLYKRLGVHNRAELLALLHHSNITLDHLDILPP